MGSFAAFGNDLYSGRRVIPFVAFRRRWYAIAIVLSLLSIAALLVIGLNPGIEFRGGSEFRLPNVSTTSEQPAVDAVESVAPGTEPPRISTIGESGLRVQTERLSDTQTDQVKDALAKAYDVSASDVGSSFVGPTWGQDVSRKAVQGLVVFLVLVAFVIGAYFRTWKMAVAALVALLHDLLLTAGVYALTGFEVTPATVIGFLTILGYSLYDTVVVFDKVRENTMRILLSTRRTYEEAANLAVNQTLVRSINTSVVALLPVGSILFIGAFLLGAGTLRDISLALFVGIAAGTYSSIFIATPLLVDLRRDEPELLAHRRKILRRRAELAARQEGGDVVEPSGTVDPALPDGAEPVAVGAAAVPGAVAAGSGAGARPGRPGQRQQPRRGGKSRPGGQRR